MSYHLTELGKGVVTNKLQEYLPQAMRKTSVRKGKKNFVVRIPGFPDVRIDVQKSWNDGLITSDNGR